jgi:hypothetical protein
MARKVTNLLSTTEASVIFALNMGDPVLEQFTVDQISMGTAIEVKGVYQGIPEKAYQVLNKNIFNMQQFKDILRACNQESIVRTISMHGALFATIAHQRNDYVGDQGGLRWLSELKNYTQCLETGKIWVIS